MEFPTLGKHCKQKDCKLLDFLPFECSACKNMFCLDHRSFAAHHCGAVPDAIIPECPLCGAIIPVAKGEDPNVKVDEHITKGCKQEPQREKSNKCSMSRCKNHEVVPVICKQCSKNFCFAHRLPQDHSCEATVKESKKVKGGGYTLGGRAPPATNKNNPTAKKVALMKMKMNAKGDEKIAPEKRYYLEVVYGSGNGVNATPKLMFFDPNWSVGKVLDSIADAGNVINKNNVSKEEDKLHLISLKTGTPLSFDVKLSQIDPSVLESGDTVLLDTLIALIPS